LGTTLIGLGTGFIVLASFDYNRMSLVKVEGYFLLTSLCIVALFIAQIKLTGEQE